MCNRCNMEKNAKNRKHPIDIARNIVVSINIGGTSGRDCLSGIFKYINSGHNWNLQLADTTELPSKMVSLRSDTTIDGFIIGYSRKNEITRKIASLPVPIVFTDLPDDSIPLERKNRPSTFVCNDDKSVGAIAAQYFIGRGTFKSFAYVTNTNASRWSRHRESGFKKSIAKHGRKCLIYRNAISGDTLTPLSEWLSRLEFPAALLASTDIVATQVIEAAKRAKILIPDQISVIGVDNDELLCNNANPSISSIQPDHETLGFTAAKELDRLIDGKSIKSTILRIKPFRKVFERGSTRPGPPAAHLIDRAMALIDLKFATITVNAVVTHLKVSRRLAYLRFKQLRNMSIHQAIVKRRIEEAKRMLQQTESSITRIAAACGFASQNRFTHSFKKHTGMSPSIWRATHKPVM